MSFENTGEIFMIEIHLWKYLAELNRCGTLSDAAKKLNLTQSALSRSMQKIEKHMGLKLFDRTKNSITLNETGKVAAECAEKILSAQKDSIEKIRAFDRRSRTISIGACAPVPMHKIIFLSAKNFPDVSISFELHGDEFILNGLQNDLFNLAVLHEEPDEENFFVKKIGGEKLFLAVPLNHKLADKDGIFFEELRGEKILLYSEIGFWYDLCKEKIPDAKFLLQNEREVFQEVRDATNFLSFTTDFFIEKNIAPKNCIYKPVLDDEADVKYYCVCKSEQKNRFKNLFAELNPENFKADNTNYSL